MQQITGGAEAQLADLLGPERPGPLVAEHVLETGNGALLVDDPRAPRLLLAMSGGNRALRGEPDPATLRAAASRLAGLIDAAPAFEAPLRAVREDLQLWPRRIFEATGQIPEPAGTDVRVLKPGDAAALGALPDEIDWIADTWSGPVGLASSGHAFGAFEDGELISVAASFFVGRRHEDIGVVTVPGRRGAGASPACAAALARAIRARGRVPSWSTSPDNTASLRVAEKLGFTLVREDPLYVVGQKTREPRTSNAKAGTLLA